MRAPLASSLRANSIMASRKCVCPNPLGASSGFPEIKSPIIRLANNPLAVDGGELVRIGQADGSPNSSVQRHEQWDGSGVGNFHGTLTL